MKGMGLKSFPEALMKQWLIGEEEGLELYILSGGSSLNYGAQLLSTSVIYFVKLPGWEGCGLNIFNFDNRSFKAKSIEQLA